MYLADQGIIKFCFATHPVFLTCESESAPKAQGFSFYGYSCLLNLFASCATHNYQVRLIVWSLRDSLQQEKKSEIPTEKTNIGLKGKNKLQRNVV